MQSQLLKKSILQNIFILPSTKPLLQSSHRHGCEKSTRVTLEPFLYRSLRGCQCDTKALTHTWPVRAVLHTAASYTNTYFESRYGLTPYSPFRNERFLSNNQREPYGASSGKPCMSEEYRQIAPWCTELLIIRWSSQKVNSQPTWTYGMISCSIHQNIGQTAFLLPQKHTSVELSTQGTCN